MTDKWDRRFIELAGYIANWSKDKSRGVGCVIVGPNREIRSAGYNGFPRGVDDNVASRHEKPTKYLWTEHAERNAIYNAALNGVRLQGSSIYVPWYPCIDCARAIIQVGITRVVCVEPEDWDYPHFHFKEVREMFLEVGMEVQIIRMEVK